VSGQTDIPKHVMRIKISSQVKEIICMAFKQLEWLEHEDFAQAAAHLETIGRSAFFGCKRLKTLI
jgi:hypothetical protein